MIPQRAQGNRGSTGSKGRTNDVKMILGLLAILFLPAAVIAQNPPAAVGGEATLSAGAEFSSFNPDYSCHNNSPFACSTQVMGPTVFFDFNPRMKWGAEGEARWLDWHGQTGESLSDYLIGGHYRLVQFGGLSVWPKFLIGGAWFQTPGYPQAGSLKGSYFTYVPGVSFEYPVMRRISARADYEYQFLPSFAGPPTNGALHNNGLTPNGFSFGISYRILGR